MHLELSETINRMNNVAAPLSNVGCSGFVSRRDPREYENILHESTMIFRAIGTSLPDICNFTFLNLVSEKIHSNEKFVFELLILNPLSISTFRRSQICAYRGRPDELLNRPSSTIAELNQARSRIGTNSARSRFRVRLFNTVPTVSTVFGDDKMDVSFYDEISRGNDAPAWRFEKIPRGDITITQHLFAHFSRNFETIWNRSDTIDCFSPNIGNLIIRSSQEELDQFASHVIRAKSILTSDLRRNRR